MKYLALVILALQIGTPTPKPSPTPDLWANTSSTTLSSTASAPWTEPSSLTMPRMVIHFGGRVILEINSNGKHLSVAADGKVTGDLPHDKAADEFWKDIALAYHPICPQASATAQEEK